MTEAGGLRVAFVGAGLIGRKRAGALRESDRIVGVFDVDSARRDAFAADHETTSFGSLEALLERQPDAVIVATTHDALAPAAVSVVRSGAHVLVEKPGGRTTEDVASIRQARDASDVIVGVGFNHRFHPAIREVIDAAEAATHGPLLFARMRYGHGGRIGYESEWRADPWRSGGGELVDQGFHLIDLSRCIAGELPVASTYIATAYWDMPVDDNAVVVLGGGATGNAPFALLHASCSEWKNLFELEVYFRTAKLVVSGLQGSYGAQVLTSYLMRPEMGPPDVEIREFAAEDVSWRDEWLAFVDSIAQGAPHRIGTLEAATYCHRVADVAYGGMEWR